MGKYYDYDYLNSIPVEDVLEQMGVDVIKGKCYCINPNCSDNSSKKPGASINKKNNTLHCFVCGETYGSIGVIQSIMGFSKNKEGYKDAAQYLSENLGYSEAIINTYNNYSNKDNPDKKEDETLSPIENAIKNIQKSFTPKYLKEIGIETNPFITTNVSIEIPKKDKQSLNFYELNSKTQKHVISLNQSIDLVINKIKETIYNYKVDCNNNIKLFKLAKTNPDNYIFYKLAQCNDKDTFDNIYKIVTTPELNEEKNNLIKDCMQDLAVNIKSEKEKINSHIKMLDKAKDLQNLIEKIMKYEPDIYSKMSQTVDEEELEYNSYDEELEL